MLADLSPLEVELGTVSDDRLPAPVEAAAYFVVCEALANVGKHAQARRVSIAVARDDGHLLVEVTDDGVGGADMAAGSGLRGLADRVAALDGRMHIVSPRAGGTSIRAVIPCG